MTGVTLAEIADVRPQAITNYETGRSTPSPRVAGAFADALKMPLEFFFLSPRPDTETPPLFLFRSMSAATKTARTRAQRRSVWISDLVNHFEQHISLPVANVPRFDLPSKPELLTNDEIEEIADAVRDYWGMRRDPIANMVALLENHGVVVSRGELGDATLDGLSTNGVPPVVMIGTDKGTPARWRFDAAHELGHLVLHRHLDATAIARAADLKLIEQQAHRFAGAFLMPMSSFGEDFFAASLDALQAIKPRWRTSIGAMIKRARNGGLISEETERRLWINYSRRGWRKQEPYDTQMEIETPSLLWAALRATAEAGALHELRQAVGLYERDIESLSSVPSGWIAQQSSAPALFPSSGQTDAVVLPIRPLRSAQ